ncbi:MAG TPA: hypothetical protein GXX49_11420 [Clostridiaceae bacterium]|nr:hypothetical protein [Clostridiaceae bacterium]
MAQPPDGYFISEIFSVRLLLVIINQELFMLIINNISAYLINYKLQHYNPTGLKQHTLYTLQIAVMLPIVDYITIEIVSFGVTGKLPVASQACPMPLLLAGIEIWRFHTGVSKYSNP